MTYYQSHDRKHGGAIVDRLATITSNLRTSPRSSSDRALDLKLEVVRSIPGLANLIITNCLLDETLNRGPE